MIYVALYVWAWAAVLAADSAGALRRVAGPAVLLPMLAVTALRGYSVDYDGYVALFDVMVQFDFPYPERLFLAKEPLMSLLIDALLWLGAGPQWMFVVMALLAIGLKQRVFVRVFRGQTAVAWAVALSLHFFLHEFTQSRVAVTLAASFLALLAVLDRRPWAWLGWCLFGAGWHVSALLFMAVSAALWLPPRWRAVGYAGATAAVCALLLLAFGWLGTVDLRAGEYEGGGGISGLMTALAVLKLAVLALMVQWLRRWPVSHALQPLLTPVLAMVVCGLVMLLVLRGVSSVIAFRFYEFFDAFAIFIVAGALMQRRALPVVTALAYCALGIVLQTLPDLFKDLVFAPWSSYVG